MDYTNSPHTADFRNRHKRQTIRSTPAGFRRISQLKPGSKARRNTVIRTIIMALVLAFGLSQAAFADTRSEEHTSELQSRGHLVCRLLLEKKNNPDARTVT